MTKPGTNLHDFEAALESAGQYFREEVRGVGYAFHFGSNVLALHDAIAELGLDELIRSPVSQVGLVGITIKEGSGELHLNAPHSALNKLPLIDRIEALQLAGAPGSRIETNIHVGHLLSLEEFDGTSPVTEVHAMWDGPRFFDRWDDEVEVYRSDIRLAEVPFEERLERILGALYTNDYTSQDPRVRYGIKIGRPAINGITHYIESVHAEASYAHPSYA